VHNRQHFEQTTFANLTAGRSGRLESSGALDDIRARVFADVRAGRTRVLNVPGDVQATDMVTSGRR
jgi:hypothetical protein